MRICSIGECMIDFSNIENNKYNFGYAGDTANFAIYLSRLGAQSSYITSVGKDILSKKMIDFLREEKVKTNNIYIDNKKTLGLYMIRNEKNGEKNFYYWRSSSAAKNLFFSTNLKSLLKNILKFDAIYFSGITLSIYDNKSLNIFYKLLCLIKNKNIKIYFDFNVRINNWPNKSIALKSIIKFSQIADIIFMTKEDLKALGLKDQKKIIYKYFNSSLVIFRSGKGQIVIHNKNKIESYNFKLLEKVKDTTGCGDAFNACFIYNYFYKNKIKNCLKAAHRLGKTVAQSKGAIINKKNFNINSYAI